MYYANYHTHTPLCNHCGSTEREIVEKAILSGIKVLGFSDHSPQVFKNEPNIRVSSMRMTVSQVDGYVNTVRSLAKEYKDDIKIYLGFEAEYFPTVFDGLYGICRDYDVDYMILGQHCLEFPGGLTFEFVVGSMPVHTLKSYVDTVIAGMETGCFTYVAHPDVVFQGIAGDEEYAGQMERLCLKAKELDIPLEVNNLGYTDRRSYPSVRFFNIAKKIGNDLIVGIDAHSQNDINMKNIEATCGFARSFGLKVTDEPVLRHPWRKND